MGLRNTKSKWTRADFEAYRCDFQKSRRRRNRKKKKKKNQEKNEQVEANKNDAEKDPEVEIEYVTEEPEIYDPNYIFFKRIFEAFKVSVYIVKREKSTETLHITDVFLWEGFFLFFFNVFLLLPTVDRWAEERKGEGAGEDGEAGNHLV